MAELDQADNLPPAFVDDDESFLQAIAQGRFPDTWRTTPDPEVALKWVKEHEIGFLVSDLRMGVVSGLDLIERARNLDPNMPAALLTGYSLTPHEKYLATSLGIAVYNRASDLELLIEHVTNDATIGETAAAAIAKNARLVALEKSHAEFVLELTAELRSIPSADSMPIIGDSQVATVSDMLGEIERLTPRGLGYLRSWRRAKATLRKRSRTL